jgi:hypothetical protein
MAEKEIVFRSKYEAHQIYNNSKKIRFVKFLYKTSDPRDIQFLRDQTKKSNVIKEIKPAKKLATVEMEEGETEEQAIERLLAQKNKKSESKSDAAESKDESKESKAPVSSKKSEKKSSK